MEEQPSILPIETMGRLPELSFGAMTPMSSDGDDDPGRSASKNQTPGKSISKTVTETITGEHEHTIVGYSLIKGIGDGEPIASERFEVGGHEWVLLFYPDGKRSSAEVANLHNAINAANAANAARDTMAALTVRDAANAATAGNGAGGANGAARTPAAENAQIGQNGQNGQQRAGAAGAGAGAGAGAIALTPSPVRVDDLPMMQELTPQQVAAQLPGVQTPENEYCALFVALIGESESPQGVVSTSDGRVVRAFHRFTLVDQSNRGQDVSKGRRRDQGAVKISCARQDPNARNCHEYRKFVKKSFLEDPARGLLMNDTIIIRYQIELVVSTGGALSRQVASDKPSKSVVVPPPNLGSHMLRLFQDRMCTDVVFDVEGTQIAGHKIILSARSPVFKALLTGPMRESHADHITIKDIKAPVFTILLYFAYADDLPVEIQGSKLDVPLAQHLLAAADRFQLLRLRCICEARLCDSVSVDTVATTLALAEQNNAKELKRVCLEFVSKHLQAVMATESYDYMIKTCPELQSQLLSVIASTPPTVSHYRSRSHVQQQQAAARNDNDSSGGDLIHHRDGRRVRARRE